MTLEGTVKTPFGEVKKQTALLVGGGVVILAVLWYRSKQASAAAAAATAGSPEINPATGYPFGSAEDAAALSNQAAYQFPTGGGTSGGGGTSIPGAGFTTNAAWVQAAIGVLTSNGAVSDAGPLTAALGKYVNGLPVTDDEKTLINMAIAVEDKPPVAGPNGYPPSINTAPVVTPPGGGGGGSDRKIFHVIPGWHVEEAIRSYAGLSNGVPGLTLGKLVALNPGQDVMANIRRDSRGSAYDTFINQAWYYAN